MRKNVFAYLIQWYLFKSPREILRGWGNVLWFNLEYFSVLLLLRTLFAPWRHTTWSPGRGFNIGKWVEALIGNAISRLLGAIIRTVLIVIGLLTEIALVVVGPFVFLAWFLLPFLLLFALYQGLFVAQFPGLQAYFFLALFAGTTFWLVHSFNQSYQEIKPVTKARNLAEFLKKERKNLRFVFNRLLLDPKEIIKRLEQSENPDSVKEFLDRVRAESHKEPEEVLAAAAKEDKGFAKILLDLKTTPNDVKLVASWYSSLRQKIKERKRWWDKKNLRRQGTLGRQWSSGFSPLLDQFSRDLSQEVQQRGFPEIIGHKKEIEALERILARDQNNNALLVGQPGSGRETIVRELAKRSALGETLPQLNYKRILQLDIPSLLAHLEGLGAREAALDQIFQEVVRSGNIILVIDEFHNFTAPTGQRAGTLNITGILSKYLASPRFPIVAMASFAGLHRDIEQNPSLLSHLEKVEIDVISQDEALQVLWSVTPFFERKYKAFISYPALKSIIAFSEKYIQAVPLPQKALDVLDEAMVALSQAKEKILLVRHIASIISEKTNIPVGEVESEEKEILLHLEDLIHKRIINQDEAVQEISSALRRARTKISSRKGPMGSFLFLGPTGVGKTETAKALASIYFGSEQRMIRLDMSEFQSTQDIERLLGSPGQEGLLTTVVRESPFSLILLDELEKAHKNVLNLFLQVLDEGHVTDGLGRRVDFTHSIIIATSNAGYQIILQALREKKEFASIKQEIFDHLFAQGIFRPEFLNRFDGVVLFQPLTKENLLDIAGLMLAKLQSNLKEKGIELSISEALKIKIADLGYNPQFGARDMRRVIQDKVENALARALLEDTMKRGDSVEIDPTTFKIKHIPHFGN